MTNQELRGKINDILDGFDEALTTQNPDDI